MSALTDAKRIGRAYFKNRNYRIRALHVLNHFVVIWAAWALEWSALWLALSLAVYFCMFCLGINIGAHRLFSHRSFKTSRLGRWVLGFCMVLATVGSPLAWAGMHRAHHAGADTDEDPHSPVTHKTRWLGFALSYLGIWRSYHASLRGSKDLRRDPAQQFFHFWYFAILIGFAATLYFTLGIQGVVFGYCLPAVACFHVASLIVTWGHAAPEKSSRTRDYSQNSLLIHLLSFGEGLHHLHHAKPALYRYRDQRWYFFDLPGFLIENVFMSKDSKGALSRDLIFDGRQKSVK